MKRNRSLWLVVALGLLMTLACNIGQSTPTTAPTEVAQTSPAPSTTEAPPLQTTQPVTQPPAATTEAPPVSGAGGCTLQAAYVTDVTIPDNTVLTPGSSFVKTWRIRNSGTCTWEAGTQLIFTSGEPLGAPTAVAVPATAPGAQVDISVSMVAPAAPNTYRSNWQLQAPDGTRFGGIFYVQIVIPAPVAPPANLVGTVAGNCATATFTWTDAQGEASYRVEGPGLSQTLAADTTQFVWNSPPAGSQTVTLVALKGDGSEIGRLSAAITVACVPTQPDLVVDSIAFSRTPAAFLPVHITVKVRNAGAPTAGSFLLRWWGGKSFSNPSCEWTISSPLATGASATLECDFIYQSPYASIASKAEVDPTNTIAEANETNNGLEQPTAVNNPAVVFDFVTKAPNAKWQGGPPLVDLPWPGGEGDSNGFARWVSSGNLETGGAIQGQCLETHPRWVDNGYIAGTYTELYTSGYTVQSGDRFRAVVGLLQNANAGNVTFKVMLRTTSSGNPWIAQVADAYGDGFKTIDVDLSPYAGQKADVILQVDAGANASQDWACWLQAVIYRYP